MLLRSILAMAFLIVVSFGGRVAYADQFNEDGFDRPGADYRSFDVPKVTNGFGDEVSICRSTCEDEKQCVAWTLVAAGQQGPDARCWLKTSIPAKKSCPTCTSGVPTKRVEARIDRPGSDYGRIENSNQKSCMQRCQADAKCNAWTFVNPGIQGPTGVCYLKNSIPDAVSNRCCTSGVADRLVVK